MHLALEEARRSGDEVPVGAVLVDLNGELLASAHNLRELKGDPTSHAEIEVIRQAAETREDWRLEGTTLFVTLEPCVMCAGAAYNTRIGRIVFGAYDEKRGFSKFGSHSDNGQGIVHPRCEVVGGVLAEECATLLTNFFRDKRD